MQRNLICLSLLISLSLISFIGAADWKCEKLIEANSDGGPITLGTATVGYSFGNYLVVLGADNSQKETFLFDLKTNQKNILPDGYSIISEYGGDLLLLKEAEMMKDQALYIYNIDDNEFTLFTNEMFLAEGNTFLLFGNSVLYFDLEKKQVEGESGVFGEIDLVGRLIKYNPLTSEKVTVEKFEPISKKICRPASKCIEEVGHGMKIICDDEVCSEGSYVPKLYSFGLYDNKIYFTQMDGEQFWYYVYDIHEGTFEKIDLPVKGFLQDVYDNKAIVFGSKETTMDIEDKEGKVEINPSDLTIVHIYDLETGEVTQLDNVLSARYLGNGKLATSESGLIKFLGKIISEEWLKTYLWPKGYLYDITTLEKTKAPFSMKRGDVPPSIWYNNRLVYTEETDFNVNIQLEQNAEVKSLGDKFVLSDLMSCETR